MLFTIDPLQLLKSIKQQYFVAIKEPEPGKGYSSVSLNKNGDHMYKKGRKETMFIPNLHKPIKLEYDFTGDEKGLEDIKKFSIWCKNNNINFFMTFPNTISHKEYFEEPYLSYFNHLMNYFNSHNINVIGKPSDAFYDLELFYDTNYHMNNKGAIIRTNNLIKQLDKILK